MAFVFRQQYEPHVEEWMRGFFKTLSEKDQRRFAAIEATRLGRGGTRYIADLLGCSTQRIVRGAAELEELPEDPAEGRVRRPGAGRKKKSNPSRNWNGT
jgi:hypothetical protein